MALSDEDFTECPPNEDPPPTNENIFITDLSPIELSVREIDPAEPECLSTFASGSLRAVIVGQVTEWCFFIKVIWNTRAGRR